MARLVLFNKPFRVMSQFRESGEKASTRAELRLDIGDVHDVLLREIVGVRSHPIEDELMQAVARPRIPEPKRFENDQWLTEVRGPRRRVLECEVPARSAESHHPVEDVVSVLNRVGVQAAET